MRCLKKEWSFSPKHTSIYGGEMNFNIVNSLEKAKRAKEKRVGKAISRCYYIIDLLLQKGYTEIELSYPLLFKNYNSNKRLCTYKEWLYNVIPTILLDADINFYFDLEKKKSDINFEEEYLILKLKGRL